MSKSKKDEYAKRFCEWFDQRPYVLQKDEKVVQCKDPYPSYWFVSNMGYIYSAYHKKIEYYKPVYQKEAKPNKEGIKTSHVWVLRYSDGNKKKTVKMHKLIADHFLDNKFDNCDGKCEVHHIKPIKTFKGNEPQKANRADNLQILPKSIHKDVTMYSKQKHRGIEEYDGVPNIVVPDLEKLIIEWLKHANINYAVYKDGESVKALLTDRIEQIN